MNAVPLYPGLAEERHMVVMQINVPQGIDANGQRWKSCRGHDAVIDRVLWSGSWRSDLLTEGGQDVMGKGRCFTSSYLVLKCPIYSFASGCSQYANTSFTSCIKRAILEMEHMHGQVAPRGWVSSGEEMLLQLDLKHHSSDHHQS